MTLCSPKNNILLSEMLDFLSCKNYPSLTLLRTKKQSNKNATIFIFINFNPYFWGYQTVKSLFLMIDTLFLSK